MLMINPQHAVSHPLQAHSALETHPCFRLILRYTRLGPWLSELRWHNGDGRQMAIISSDHALDLQRIAGSLQLEFTAARFLSYQRDNPTLDRVGHVTSRNVNQPNEYQPGQGCRSDSAGANAFLQSVKLIAFRAQDMLM